MMAAYQPQHPGMAPHGHPVMTPGGQPMPQQMQQMQQMQHPGVSGPGQPHVTQASAMMGMQPGAMAGMGGQPPGAQMGGMPGQMGGQSMAGGMPNANAMHHLNPQQMQTQQMIQQQMAQNPNYALQRQQQIMHQRAMQAQIQAAGGMNPNAMQGMTPQQMQQLQQQQQQQQQQNPGMHPGQVQLPAHLVQQQQALLLHQRQQAAQQNMQQQQLAMQQQQSQQSNQGGQPGPPNQQAAQGQQPGQMRPQSRMANPNEQNAAQAQNAQQGQQGQPQGQQGQAGAQQPNPQQPGQQPQMTQAQMQQMMQRRQMMQMQQQQNAIAAQRGMAQPQQMTGQAILFVLSMCDYLCQFGKHNGLEIDTWRGFVDKHFAQDAELSHTFSYGEGQSKEFKVLRPSIARYFHQYFASGATSIRIHLEYVKEERMPPANRLRMSSGHATLRVEYENGARLEMRGTLTADFGPSMVPEAIEQLTFWTQTSEEVIGRTKLQETLTSYSPTMSNKGSPKMTKKNPPKGQQKMQSQFEGLTIDNFPKARTGIWGSPVEVQTFLELGETFNVMADLMAFAHEKKLRPDSALEAINQQYQKEGPPGSDPNQQQMGNPQLNLPPNGVSMGNRTPSMQSMGMPAQNQFHSPSVSNLNLPMQNGMPMNGSPHISHTPGLQPGGGMGHTPSPGHQNMQAPAMMPQHSQQGTNSSAASANTSPQVNNKRRRSTVKTEDEGGGIKTSSPAMNRKKGKAS